MNVFRAVVIGIFAAFAVGALVALALFSSSGKSTVGTVVFWGSVPQEAFNQIIAPLSAGGGDYSGVAYQFVPPDQLVPQLVQAIASGKSPDIVMLPEEDLVGNTAKLQQISYTVLSRRDFQDTFIQATENFLGPQGSYGIPFTVDPLVMYWNRTLFSDAGIASPPAYWDELADDAARLTKADQNGTLSRSAVALGGWQNVTHAKEVILSLFYQLGDPVIEQSGTGYASVLDQRNGAAVAPADSALSFYTDFANPHKADYSWNSSRPDAKDAFLAGTLAVYFGFASELSEIRAANPNLNFDVAPLPSIRGGGTGGYADVTALAIPRGASNPSGALAVIQAFTTAPSQTILAGFLHMPSVRRDVAPESGADPYAVVFRNASLTAFSFLDPDPAASDAVFERMVENVTSGKLQVSAAAAGAEQDLKALLGTP